MKKKLLLLSILLSGLTIFTSCSSNDSGDDTPAAAEPLPIAISSTSSEILTIGENFEITGANFLNKDYPTKIFINGTEVTAKEISNTKIVLSIPDGLITGTNTLRVQIKNVNSSVVNFYSITKGWTKLTTLGNLDIQSSSVLDNSKTIFSFVNNITSDNGSFWGAPKKLEAKSTGYEQVYINQSGSYGDFRMIDDKTGALTNTIAGFFTDNGFETQKRIDVDNHFSPAINGLKIGYLDNNICILTTVISGQIYTADKGATITKSDPPAWATIIGSGGGVGTRLSISAFGKSVSDNKFYQVGVLYTPKNGVNNLKNVILQSETGYNNWIVKDSVSKQINSKIYPASYKFVNINKIFGLNNEDKTLYASTDMLQTWNPVKTDVKAFFLRTETQWYIQSGDKLFVTKNSGASWELELELPAGSVINDISFAKTKIIVSGNKGLHYLKLE
ncbi:hypothetical protein GCM10022422_02190 [Flavobacterium ginsengisoli]|uniref:IPT/TIG domain-containing protein n=1 Tax=Flavobacterium ginsengisoli TaxID=871694 RepID=A0ABP7ETM6_9FLAO